MGGARSIDHEAKLGRVLAFAAIVQERLEPFAQIFRCRGRTAKQKRLPDILPTDIDLFEASQGLLNGRNEVRRDWFGDHLRRNIPVDEASCRRFEEIEILLNDRVFEIVQKGLTPAVD